LGVINLLLNIQLELPLRDPVLVFALVLLILLIAPLAFNRLKIPGIIGLIISGVLIGPHGFNLLERDESVELFSTIGILYIMFLAGLELELNEFLKNRVRSLVFGALTFILPFGAGYAVADLFMNLSFEASFLIGLMMASHTLVAYPIASRLGIHKNRVVMITVGGTILADSLVLILLAVIRGVIQGDLSPMFWVKIFASIIAFLFFIFYFYPKIGRWFFKNMEGERNSQFVFVLAMVFVAAFLAELAGFEAIIGAFMSGLALNRLIPAQSALMSRLEFVGNSIFIPFFLISVGMMVDVKVFLQSWGLLATVGILATAAISSKWLAAWITQKRFHFNKTQRNVIFGLSTARAAATIAVVLVGFEAGVVDGQVVNATVALILITSLVGSIVTERSGKKLAAMELRYTPQSNLPEDRILIPVANPATVEYLLDFALSIRRPDSPCPVMALSVIKDDEKAREQSREKRKLLQNAIHYLTSFDVPAEAVTRIDMSPANGIVRAMNERSANELVMGWSDRKSTVDFFFGNLLQKILKRCFQMVYVLKQIHPLNTNEDIFVVLSPNARFEQGFSLWVDKIVAISKNLSAQMHFLGDDEGLGAVHHHLIEQHDGAKAHYQPSNFDQALEAISKQSDENDLIVLISARTGTLSHHDRLETLPKELETRFTKNNLLAIFPLQKHEHTRPGDGYPITSPPHFKAVRKLNRAFGKWRKKSE
jgi:Kef-type K+ transport system membrane component KefB